MSRNRHLMTLVDLATGRQLSQNGQIKVVEAGGTSKVSIAESSTAAYVTAETLDFSNGKIEFYHATTISKVDIYYYTEKGYCGVVKDVEPGSVSEVSVDINRLNQTLLFPFDASDADFTAATDIDTGIKLGDEVCILPSGLGVQVITADVGEELDVGVVSTSGVTDADGILANLSVGAVGNIQATVGYAVGSNSVLIDLTGGAAEWTYGALMHPSGTKVAIAEGTDVDTEANGIYIFDPHVVDGSSAANQEKLTYNLSAGSDTGAGIIRLPLILPQPRL
jgi:hypothetical protein